MAVPADAGNPAHIPAHNPTRGDRAILVAGPTASGKSALAMELARRFGGTVINADAMQCYRELCVLTARPTAADEAAVPHALYGFRAAADAGTAATWREAALQAMRDARDAGRMPILCGGTGMYFAALTQGLAEIPEPGPAAREEARGLLGDIGPAALHARLAAEDPATAARLRPTDSQRLARAWEVWRGTGTGLAAWQAGPSLPPAPYSLFAVLLDPPRDMLRASIAARFEVMLAGGAVEEVRALLALQLDPDLPLMRAHGVPELASYLRGEATITAAAARAVQATVAYTKRQATWFRHHDLAPRDRVYTINSPTLAYAQFMESISARIGMFLNEAVDAPQHGP
jgi:tRNA dimethylallyltransferase